MNADTDEIRLGGSIRTRQAEERNQTVDYQQSEVDWNPNLSSSFR